MNLHDILNLIFNKKRHVLDVDTATEQEEVHHQKNIKTAEFLRFHHQSATIREEVKQIKRVIDTATRIALATPGGKHGI